MIDAVKPEDVWAPFGAFSMAVIQGEGQLVHMKGQAHHPAAQRGPDERPSGAGLVLNALPPAAALIADRGYDSNWLRRALFERGIEACIPSTKSRRQPLDYDKVLYRQRHRIGNMFAKLC